MTISYNVPVAVSNEYAREAKKRGYSEALSSHYVEDRKEVYKKSAPISDAIVIGTVAATAGKIALDARKTKTTFWNAAKKQFAPFRKTIRRFAEKTAKEIKDKSALRVFDKAFVNGAVLPFKGIKGLWHSMPNKIKWPAALLMAGLSIKTYSENNKIDAKYDTLKFVQDHRR